MPLAEPAVALTDYALVIECAVFVLLLSGRDTSDRTLRFWFVVFFASIGGASLLGGTVHGFFPDAASPGRRVLWMQLAVFAFVALFVRRKFLHRDHRLPSGDAISPHRAGSRLSAPGVSERLVPALPEDVRR